MVDVQRLIGMEKQAAIDLLHSKGNTVRIAVEEGIDNRLQGGYTPGRVNLTITEGKVSAAEEG